MEQILQMKKSNCKNCHKCIRECPVKSIRFTDHQAHIIPEECILCGMCFVACTQNAKMIRNDIPKAKEFISSGNPVVVSLAPSFISDFGLSGIEPIEEALKKLGFSIVLETAIGAQLVTKEYERLISENKMPVIISSCCHTVNLLIQKYFPEALCSLAPIVSPMIAHAKLIKEQNPNNHVVFIGPCLSKKDEAQKYGFVDCVLTFEELREWLECEKIVIDRNVPISKDLKKTRAFPTLGGIIRSMGLETGKFDYFKVDGMEQCISVLQEVSTGKLNNCFIEMSSCKGSCIGGPATKNYHKRPLMSENFVEKFTGNEEYNIDKTISLSQKHSFTPVSTQKPTNKMIDEMLIKMGKTLPEHQLNCKFCGYNTCHDKAIAICEGKAELSMCLPFLLEKSESFSDAIITNTPNAITVMDDKLKIQQINPSACILFGIENKSNIIGEDICNVLGEADYINLVETHVNSSLQRRYLSKFKKYVDEFIVFDREYRLIISIMRDVTENELVIQQKERIKQQTVAITDKVIQKQMRVAQEIASLLGETTAETKIALTRLKNTLQK